MARKAPPACEFTNTWRGGADVEVLRIAPEKRKDATERARLLNAADVAFLCLPDAAAREAASWVTNPNTCLIDASTAHRTDPSWVFGLPELAPGQRAAIRSSQAHRQPGLPRQRLHPAAAAPRRRPAAAARPWRLGHVDHRLLGWRQEDDRAVRGGRRSGIDRAAALCADAAAQARAGDDGRTPDCARGRSSCRWSATSTRAWR